MEVSRIKRPVLICQDVDQVWASSCELVVDSPRRCNHTSSTLIRQRLHKQAQAIRDGVGMKRLSYISDMLLPCRRHVGKSHTLSSLYCLSRPSSLRLMTCTALVSLVASTRVFKLTQHRSTLILLPPSLAHVARDSQINDGEVFDRVLLRVQPTYDGKATTLVHVRAHLTESVAEVGKRERLARNLVAVQTVAYLNVNITTARWSSGGTYP